LRYQASATAACGRVRIIRAIGRRVAAARYNFAGALEHLYIVWTPEKMATGSRWTRRGAKMPEGRIGAPEYRDELV